MAKKIVSREEWFRAMNAAGASGNYLEGYVVFSNKNVEKGIWRKFPNTEDGMWPIEERTYVVSSNSKYFLPGMCGNSIFASNLAETDFCKLSACWFGEGWIEEEFYFEEMEN